MNWRDTLGVRAHSESTTQYTHNPQYTPDAGNSAYCADSADGIPEREEDRLLDNLSTACRGLGITPEEVRKTLAPEDVEEWRKGSVGTEVLAALARCLVQRREMDRGVRPAEYTKLAKCTQCGPVWLWFSGEVVGCPWCWNRMAGRPIPRPDRVSGEG